LARSRSVFDLSEKQQEIAELEQRTQSPGFWDVPERAQRQMQDLSELREELALWETLDDRAKDVLELLELGELEDEGLGAEMQAELEREAQEIAALLDRAEFELMMSEKYDRSDAILAIHAGAGGTEAQDWAQMVLRMYLRWAERKGFGTEIMDSLSGEEAGIKRAMVNITGRYAYGFLKAERGVHRLVRISPFDASHRRHTSFCLVEVWPDMAEDIEIEIRPDEIEMDVYRSSGAGGQHMQKNATAVRLTHIPTGIIVTCENERSQSQNREYARKILKAKLYEREKAKQEEEQARLKGDHVEAGWGNQIRSYVLHPYNMVKDLRTGVETGNTGAVLDGDLDRFIDAYLRQTMSG
jgi:peptide chain release factor 2